MSTASDLIEHLAWQPARLDPALPGPRGLPWIGSVHEVWRDPLSLFDRGLREFGDTVRYRFGPYTFVVINDPEDIRHVLVSGASRYRKSPSYATLELLLGKGLVTSEGELWKRQRKLMQPAFHRERLAALHEAMRTEAEAFAGELLAEGTGVARPGGRRGARELDLHHALMGLTLRIVGRSLFSVDLGPRSDAIGRALEVALRFANDYTESFVKVPVAWPTPPNLRFRAAKRELDRMVMKIIEARKGSRGHDDLLAMLMDATDEGDGRRMSDEQLRDEVMTLVLAGHETTANLLSWSLAMLSLHPSIARRVREEIARVVGDGPIRPAHLAELVELGQVLSETLRLYPPAWIIERQALQADRLPSGAVLPAAAIVGVCPHTLHRHPRLWPNPEGFDPRRFAPDAAEQRHKFAFLPFGAGQRTCIGNNFALMEAKIVLATLLARVDIALIPGQPLVRDPGVTLRPKGGLRFEVAPAAAVCA